MRRHVLRPGRLVLLGVAVATMVIGLAVPASMSAPTGTDRDPVTYRTVAFEPTPGKERLPQLQGHSDPDVAAQFGQTVEQADRWGLQQEAAGVFTSRFADLYDRLVGQRFTGTTRMGYDVLVSGSAPLPVAESTAQEMADTLGIEVHVRYADVPPSWRVQDALREASPRFAAMTGVGRPSFDVGTAKVVVDYVPGTADVGAVRALADQVLGPVGLAVDLEPVASVEPVLRRRA